MAYNSFETLIDIINSFPEMPEEIITNGGVQISETDGRKESLAIAQVGSQISEYLCGDKLVDLEYKIIYQKATQTNEEKLECLRFMGELFDWIMNSSTLVRPKNSPQLFNKNNNGLDRFEMSMYCWG